MKYDNDTGICTGPQMVQFHDGKFSMIEDRFGLDELSDEATVAIREDDIVDLLVSQNDSFKMKEIYNGHRVYGTRKSGYIVYLSYEDNYDIVYCPNMADLAAYEQHIYLRPYGVE